MTRYYDEEAEVLKRRPMASSLSCIGVIWALLSFASMGLSCVGFFMPYWIKGTMANDTPTYLGTFRRCNYLGISENGNVDVVFECGRYATFFDIPSLWWQIATVVIGVGCGLTVVIAFTAMFACCCQDVITVTSARITGIIQFLAGLLIGIGMLLYAIGWDTSHVRKICGSEASMFNSGSCHLMWAFYLTGAGAGSAILCTFLTCKAVRQKYRSLRTIRN